VVVMACRAGPQAARPAGTRKGNGAALAAPARRPHPKGALAQAHQEQFPSNPRAVFLQLGLDERFYSQAPPQAGFGPNASVLHTPPPKQLVHHSRAKPGRNGACGLGMEPADSRVPRVEAFSLVQWRTRPEIALV